ncbi:unnamed protein product [Paramecium octaurelia]|uniref:Uncharacterized protein n=1 Tax=Paramecium octaurelia TaxID=43137 RepID=A0A8S1WZB5_PAROT|nr:unnamed protein product [Paramecium octaurelia]
MVIPAQFIDSQTYGWYLHSFLTHQIRGWYLHSFLAHQIRGWVLYPTAGIRISIRLWDVKTGQQKAKLDGHSSYVLVYSVNFSPNGNTLASCSSDKSIRLWNVRTSKEIIQSDSNYKDLLAQFNISLQNSSLLPNVNPDRTILRICQNPILEASGTLILKGQFVNYQGIDLKPLFKTKGSFFFEDLKQKQK